MTMKKISDKLVVKAYLERRRIINLLQKAYKEEYYRYHIYPYHLLKMWTNECEKVCYRAMERAAERDFIDYGVSLRTGWVTEQGKDLLNG